MNQDEYIQIPMGGPVVPQAQRSDRADLLDKIKPDVIVEEIRQRLMGNQLVNGRWTSIPVLKDKALTEEGAWELSNLMLSTSSINASISNLNDSEVKQRLFRIACTAQYMCISNWRRYGIKNSAQLWFVHEVIFTNTLVVLKQADGATIQELLKGTVTENRNINSDQSKQQGLLRRMIGI